MPAIEKETAAAPGEGARTVYTVGHSTRDAAELVSLVAEHGVALVADVRRFPASRRHPHFNADRLAATLAEAGVAYEHLEALGGRRTPRPDSENVAWREAGFRGYADYMATPEFREGVERLERLAAERPTAVLCSEAVWWRCHRALLADYLKAAGWRVVHILGPGSWKEHPFTAPARVVDGRLTYATQPNLPL